MKGYLITKKIERDVGWLEPEFETYEVGSITVPEVNLYFLQGVKQPSPLTEQVRADMFPSATPEKIGESPNEAMEHILELGRRIHGDDSFYRQIDIPDDLLNKVLETQRAMKETPKNLAHDLAHFVGQVLSTASA